MMMIPIKMKVSNNGNTMQLHVKLQLHSQNPIRIQESGTIKAGYGCGLIFLG